ncbi:MAG: ATP-binding protein [Lachnospiraceae bacterium]|nr:ATP-binding protein [Lachnospiraceae bacterium]
MDEHNQKNRSIARKINRYYLWKQLGISVGLDILLFVLLSSIFIYQMDVEQLGRFRFSNDRVLKLEEEYLVSRPQVVRPLKELGHTVYCVTEWNGQEGQRSYELRIGPWLMKAVMAGAILILVQILYLFDLFRKGSGHVRQTLRPLNEMAARAQVLSEMALDESKYQNLEEAIEKLKVDRPDARIQMQDKELEGIERALNDLLDRMRASYKQQTQFVSDASHELRTPIAVIQGYVNMLDRWGKEDSQILEESIEAIKNEATHMQKLVEQLLFLARGDSGRQNVEMREHKLNDMMREVYEESLMIDEKHSYRFTQCGEAVVYGDGDLIKQSARILLDNAAKYTPEGNEILIRVGIWDDGSPFYGIQDQGIGMAEHDVQHVFDRFYRADAVRNSKTGGTGLGLSIAKWIVEKHGAYVNIVSREGIGTRFSVIFPKK